MNKLSLKLIKSIVASSLLEPLDKRLVGKKCESGYVERRVIHVCGELATYALNRGNSVVFLCGDCAPLVANRVNERSLEAMKQFAGEIVGEFLGGKVEILNVFDDLFCDGMFGFADVVLGEVLVRKDELNGVEWSLVCCASSWAHDKLSNYKFIIKEAVDFYKRTQPDNVEQLMKGFPGYNG